ncbi:MAG: hypothetical protein GWN61_10150 [candidate division Zixibacteria bacterium]|nr:hypothetical protein [candidate division Zixibacteria bacterium]NIS46404.1 hypothetical protein [candidate division Zixibacteria bacterium]NIU14493.1 hypothetical protein [candidate division Zixibacteria bacterium]NIV06522.1 hypothetical protein [candidate division Zixibacteria bacterium]
MFVSRTRFINMTWNYKIFFACLSIFILAGSPLYAQGMILDFSYDKSTYHWEDSVWLDNKFSDNIRVQAYNSSTATLIKKSLFLNSRDRWQKNANTNVALIFNPENRFSWGITAFNNYNRLESRRVGINRLGLHQDFRLSDAIKLRSQLSYSEATRHYQETKERDQGVMQKVDLTYVGNLFGLGSLGAAYNHELNLLQRTPEKSFGLDLGFANGDTGQEIQINYSGNYQQNKFFTDLTSFENVTTQNKYEHQGDLHLNLNLIKKLDLDLLSNYSYRRFEYTENEDDVLPGIIGRDNLTATFYYKLAGSYPLFGVSLFKTEYIYRDSDEEFGDLFSGQNITLGELRLSYYISWSEKDSLYASGTFSVTTYTGKDPNNLFSDRDRVFKLGQMVYQRDFSDHFLLRLRGSYQYNHYIYISEQLSANNNHNIVYLAQPEVIWTPSAALQISHSWVMHANYIYYDYEKYEESQRNTLYRKADYLVKLNYSITRNLDLLLSYRYRYEDFGQLVYRDQWAQRISWDRNGHLPSIEMFWRPFNELLINSGYSYERKRSFDHLPGEVEGTRILQEKELFEREKIFINMNYRPGNKSRINFSYTRRVQESKSFLNEDSDIITLNVSRYF